MHYIYEIKNKLNGKTYIGQRKCPINKFPETDTKYMGSGVYIKNAMKKYGIENFEKKIIAISETTESIDILEKVFIKLYRKEGKAEYNMADGGQIRFTMSEEVKKKLSKSRRNYISNHPESLIEHSNKMKGRKLSKETRKKISESNKGKKMSEESKIKIGERHKGKNLSEETKEKLRQANLGKKTSEETKRKISESNKGKKMSKESIEKMKMNHVGSKDKHWKLSEKNKNNISKGLIGVNTWTKNKKWFTDGKINKRCEICPDGFYEGRTLSENTIKRMTSHANGVKTKGSKGMHWFTNGVISKLCYECPEGFIKGRCKRNLK